MNEILGQHDLLLESSSRETAIQHAHYFFEHNQLVRYDSLVIDSGAIISGNDLEFLNKVKAGIEANREAINRLVKELHREGAADPQNWASLKQGYASKLLHTTIHLLDGFFGIDSALYNLIENSHQVTNSLLTNMQKNPEQYWLVPVKGISAHGDANQLPLLRPFGKKEKKT